MSAAGLGPVVTLDGPAGSGKSSTAREVAKRLGFRHLDSGALYRAITFALLDAGVPEDRWGALAEEELRSLGIELVPDGGAFQVRVGGRPVSDELRTAAVTDRVARVATLPATRGCLLHLQRAAGEGGRLVADGRDMGTVVFPDAEVKIYLVADLEERARRRLAEQGVAAPDAHQLAAGLEALEARDRQDSERRLSPLRRPPGAHVIDTTGRSFEEQVDAIVSLVRPLTPS
jgi:cytidylate kinase